MTNIIYKLDKYILQFQQILFAFRFDADQRRLCLSATSVCSLPPYPPFNLRLHMLLPGLQGLVLHTGREEQQKAKIANPAWLWDSWGKNSKGTEGGPGKNKRAGGIHAMCVTVACTAAFLLHDSNLKISTFIFMLQHVCLHSKYTYWFNHSPVTITQHKNKKD